MLCDNIEEWDGVEGRFKREGTYVCLWLIHVDVLQKLTQYCKAIILQLKIKRKKSWSLSDIKYECLTYHPIDLRYVMPSADKFILINIQYFEDSKMKVKWSESHSVMSDSLLPPSPGQNSPGQNTAVGSLPFSRASSQLASHPTLLDCHRAPVWVMQQFPIGYLFYIWYYCKFPYISPSPSPPPQPFP